VPALAQRHGDAPVRADLTQTYQRLIEHRHRRLEVTLPDQFVSKLCLRVGRVSSGTSSRSSRSRTTTSSRSRPTSGVRGSGTRVGLLDASDAVMAALPESRRAMEMIAS
jgi:hypothetical protein